MLIDKDSEKILRFLARQPEDMPLEQVAELYVKSKGEYVNHALTLRRALGAKEAWAKFRHKYESGIRRYHNSLSSRGLISSLGAGLKKQLVRSKEGKNENYVMGPSIWEGLAFSSVLSFCRGVVLEETAKFDMEEQFVEKVFLGEQIDRALMNLQTAAMRKGVVEEKNLEIVLSLLGEEEVRSLWSVGTDPILESDTWLSKVAHSYDKASEFEKPSPPH